MIEDYEEISLGGCGDRMLPIWTVLLYLWLLLDTDLMLLMDSRINAFLIWSIGLLPFSCPRSFFEYTLIPFPPNEDSRIEPLRSCLMSNLDI